MSTFYVFLLNVWDKVFPPRFSFVFTFFREIICNMFKVILANKIEMGGNQRNKVKYCRHTSKHTVLAYYVTGCMLDDATKHLVYVTICLIITMVVAHYLTHLPPHKKPPQFDADMWIYSHASPCTVFNLSLFEHTFRAH